MVEELEKLRELEARLEQTESKHEARLKKLQERGGVFATFDIDQKLEEMKQHQSYKTQPLTLLDGIIRGVTWGNIFVWDRSYEPKYNFSLAQRSKIIDYMYDRFSLRAGKVSREVGTFPYVPHENRLKSRSERDLKKYLNEINLVREQNQHILTNALWGCHARAKYASMLWGMLISSAFCSLVIPKKSLPKKAFAFYVITFSSMFFSRVAFSERVIDVYYPIFKQDVERIYGEMEKELNAQAFVPLGKSRPVHSKMTEAEKKLHITRLDQMRKNKGLLATRFDEELNNTAYSQFTGQPAEGSTQSQGRQ